MPIGQLFCEGGESSPDGRVLSTLLKNRCRVVPFGGRYGMGDRIKAARAATGRDGVFGILDGDFVRACTTVANRPRVWEIPDGTDTTHLGWRWERKEIENYLIDPVVVELALGTNAPDSDEYIRAMEGARDALTIYQAARTALSNCRPRFQNLKSAFGRPRGKEQHPFPDELSESACRNSIDELVRKFNEAQHVRTCDVEARFAEILPECSVGERYFNYLHYFAGKDLMIAMEGFLTRAGFGSWAAFREKILIGIEATPEDIADWLPEWKALQAEIDSL